MFRENKQSNISENDVSEKYKKMSSYFGILKWISLIIIVIYILVSVSLHGEELSFDSIRYIVRYMKDDPLTLVSDGDVYEFDYESSNKAYILGNDFAVIGKQSIAIYDFSGKVLFSDNCPYDNPVAISYGNELIVYEIGKTELRFYNSYSLVERMNFESPVYDVTIAENGNFLVMTASDGYRSGFRIYNNHKKLLLRCNFGEFSLQTTSISNDGNSAVAVSALITDNNVSSVLNIYEIPAKEPTHTETIEGEYPISAHYLNDNIVLLTDKNIRFYNSNYEIESTISFENKEPLEYRVFKDRIAITYRVSVLSQDTKIEIIDSKGERIRDITLDSSVFDVNIVGDFVHVLRRESIETYSLSDGSIIKKTALDKTYNSINKITEDKFLLMCPNEARIFIFAI